MLFLIRSYYYAYIHGICSKYAELPAVYFLSAQLARVSMDTVLLCRSLSFAYSDDQTTFLLFKQIIPSHI